jgi:hypothetical protein
MSGKLSYSSPTSLLIEEETKKKNEWIKKESKDWVVTKDEMD